VFDAADRLVALTETPGGFVPLEIGSDYVTGRRQNEADVEYVRIHALRNW